MALDYKCAVGTDDFMRLPWEAVPNAVIRVLSEHDSWLLEGVQALRVLRRWIRDRDDFPGVDVCYYLTTPLAERTPRHWSMAKAIEKHWRDVMPRLVADGTQIIREVMLDAG